MPAPAPSAPPAPATWRRRLGFVLRLGATLALCGWIVWAVDWAEVGQHLRGAHLGLLLLTILLRPLGTWFSALKWQLLLASRDRHYPMRQLLRWYLAAMFLGHFLPTSIGGDAYRVYRTMKSGANTGRALSAVLVERLTGILALALIGWAAAVVLAAQTQLPLAREVAWLTTLGLALGCFGFVILLRLRLLNRLHGVRLLAKPLGAIQAMLADFSRHRARMMAVMGLSFAFHLNRILVIWITLWALSTPLSFIAVALTSAIVEAAGLLPISLGGLGVIEASFMLVSAQFGLAAEAGFATALLLRIMLLPTLFIGGYCYLYDPSRNQPLARPMVVSPGTRRQPVV
jgi:glycosyltransferase 2 family protein